MEYVALTDVWAYNGLASIVVASLEDAGFHPVTEWGPFGPMHFYAWPLGSSRPTTIWIPASELREAQGYIRASCEPSWESVDQPASLWTVVSKRRRLIYALWLVPTALEVTWVFGSTLALVLVPLLRSLTTAGRG